MLACHSRACPSKDSGLRLTPREAALAVLSPFVAVLLRAGSAKAPRAEAGRRRPKPRVQPRGKELWPRRDPSLPSRTQDSWRPQAAVPFFLSRPSAVFGIPRGCQIQHPHPTLSRQSPSPHLSRNRAGEEQAGAGEGQTRAGMTGAATLQQSRCNYLLQFSIAINDGREVFTRRPARPCFATA